VSDSSPHLRVTSDAYDAFAAVYADFARNALADQPLDRAALAVFAEVVQGPVADLGCGPGHTTAHLRGLGLDIFGLDLSPVMVDLARQAYPELRFDVGSMDALDLTDGALGGIVSWYSAIHTPPEELPAYFAEFRRVLAPGGHLLLAFFESEGDPVTVFDHKVTPAYRWPVDDLATMAKDVGLVEVGRVSRAPHEGERFRHARLLTRVPTA
jgi:SAM-dependent methyltransferase